MIKRKPLVVKVANIASAVLLALAMAAAAFIAGYSLAFFRVADVYAETEVLKAKAQELEAEILHLRNYAVLIDAIALSGQAVGELQNLPHPAPQEPQDTTDKEAADEY